LHRAIVLLRPELKKRTPAKIDGDPFLLVMLCANRDSNPEPAYKGQRLLRSAAGGADSHEGPGLATVDIEKLGTVANRQRHSSSIVQSTVDVASVNVHTSGPSQQVESAHGNRQADVVAGVVGAATVLVPSCAVGTL
jgi:hypothetical protein